MSFSVDRPVPGQTQGISTQSASVPTSHIDKVLSRGIQISRDVSQKLQVLEGHIKSIANTNIETLSTLSAKKRELTSGQVTVPVPARKDTQFVEKVGLSGRHTKVLNNVKDQTSYIQEDTTSARYKLGGVKEKILEKTKAMQKSCDKVIKLRDGGQFKAALKELQKFEKLSTELDKMVNQGKISAKLQKLDKRLTELQTKSLNLMQSATSSFDSITNLKKVEARYNMLKEKLADFKKADIPDELDKLAKMEASIAMMKLQLNRNPGGDHIEARPGSLASISGRSENIDTEELTVRGMNKLADEIQKGILGRKVTSTWTGFKNYLKDIADIRRIR